MGEPLMHIFNGHISSPTDQWTHKETDSQKHVETLVEKFRRLIYITIKVNKRLTSIQNMTRSLHRIQRIHSEVSSEGSANKSPTPNT